MNNNAIERTGNNGKAIKALDDEWRLMNTALERLGQVEAREQTPARRGSRLIFGLDLTHSREASLRQARIATAAMFDTIKAIGTVAVKLIYYRGSECRAGEWHDDPGIVSAAMLRLSCKGGHTQIRKVLRHALNEKEPLSGVVFIGDHCEATDDGYELDDLAVKLGQKGIPIFVFHEVNDQDSLALRATPIFEHIAKVSGGEYTEFKPDSGAILRELLATVAVFSAAGCDGLKQLGQPLTPEARQLQTRLLLGPAAECKWSCEQKRITMNFEPRTEKEIAESKLWPQGEYDFEIVEAFEKVSQSSGNPMIELKLKLSNGKGISRTISDYLLKETPEKLRHAADACRVLDRYDSGSLSDTDFRGKRGRLKLGIEKDRKRKYPDKNVVLDYVCASGAAKLSAGVRLSFQS